MMRCNMCQRVPTHPVVSAKSGHVFERGLVEAYIDEHGRCPITGEPLSRADLIAVHGATPETSVAASGSLGAASVPTLLERLQAEWEGAALEQFSLRQQVEQMRLELAHALQQHDAACRVIARLSRELDSLRGGAANGANGDASSSAAADVVVPPAVLQCMDAAEAAGRQARKQRKAAAAAAAPPPSQLVEEQQWMAGVATSSTPAARSALRLATAADGASLFVSAATGDHAVAQYARDGASELARGLGHTAAVHTLVSLPNNVVLSAAEDATVRMWTAAAASALTVRHTLRFAGGVAAMSRRTVGDAFVLCGAADGAVTLSDLECGLHVVSTAPLSRSTAAAGAQALTCVELHPYASLAAVALQPLELQLWDARTLQADTAIALPRARGAAQPHIRSVDFSADCVSVAAGLSDGAAHVWDLRQTAAPTAVLPAATASGTAAATVRYAPDGRSLIIAGHGVALYDAAQLASAAPASSAGSALSAVCDACWSADGAEVFCGSVDGVVRVYSASASS